MANSTDRSELLKRVREKMLQKKGGRRRDPKEWKAPQIGAGKSFKAKAYILPPTEAMDGLWFFQVGDHWVQQEGKKRRYPCPRVYDGGNCPYCQLGFDLLNETDDKKTRSDISRAYLPRTQYVVNVFFPDDNVNPQEIRGQVMFYAMPKTVFDKLDECIQREDAGNDSDKPEAWGLFYDPEDAYPLSISITHKGGFNNYEKSELIATARRPIGSAEEIEKILAQANDVPSKYPERSKENLEILQKLSDVLLNGSDDDDDDDDGFDADETQTSKSKAEPKAAPKTKPAKAAEPKSDSGGDTVQVEDEELDALLNSIRNES